MDELEQKRSFAFHLLRVPDKPFEAASVVFPEKYQVGLALTAARDWLKDPIVIAEQERILGGVDAKSFLPTKEMQAKDIYAIAKDPLVTVEDRLKAHKQYSEIMGFIEKPAPGNQVNILNQSVMVVRDLGTDDDWETKAIKQQRTLTAPEHVN